MNANDTTTIPAGLRTGSLNLRSILVPIDFSPQSENAFKYASVLADKFHAKLTLLFVAEPIPYPFHAPADEAAAVEKARERLEKLRAPDTADDRSGDEHIIRRGRPSEEICRAAAALESDLVVIATHGSGGLEHMLLGGTAEQVVRHAKCPVLVVRLRQTGGGGASRDAGRNSPIQFKKLLVPLDFSGCSWKALEYAVPLTRRFGAELVLFHTVELYPVVCEGSLVDVGAVECQMRECAERMMQELRQELPPEIHPEAVIGNGAPQIEIVRAAEQLNIDLIVLTTQGHTGLAHMLLGSTAEKVIRHAPCPVLVVRECEHEFVTTQSSEAG